MNSNVYIGCGKEILSSKEITKNPYLNSTQFYIFSIINYIIMIITICGSRAFKEKMIEFKEKLKELGHEAIVHPDFESFVSGEKKDLWEKIQKDHASVKKENNYIKWYNDAIINSDAILVLNYEKRGIKNYIGGNTLMEIGFAFVNDKKIFLLNDIPEVSYKDEILATYDLVLNGNLTKIE